MQGKYNVPVLNQSTTPWRPILELNYRAVKTYGRMEMYLHDFLSSTLDGGEWWALHLSRFTPG
jgi:hypothetical protein